MKQATTPSRFVVRFFVPTLVALVAASAPVSAIPELDPPDWRPLPIIYSRTQTNPGPATGFPAIAFDFSPWDAVKAWDGDFYGFVNDGAAPGGLVYALSAKGVTLPGGGGYAPGKPRLVYQFPNPRNLATHRLTGSHPTGAMAEGQDGNTYGRTADGGAFGNGVLFKVDRSGHYQALHHLEKHGVANGLIVAQNGDVYSATTADNSTDVGWVFRLSKDGSYKNIPVASGQMGALVETANHDILVATTTASQAGVLWRLNASDEFEQLAQFSDTPGKLVPLANGDVLCLTTQAIVEVTPAGVTSVAHQFDPATEGTAPNFLEEDDPWGFYGSTSAGGPNHGGTGFRMDLDYGNFRSFWNLEPFIIPGRSDDHFTLWMDEVFPTRIHYLGNHAPMAKDDVVSVTALKRSGPTQPQIAVVRVLDNDVDADKDRLTIASVSTPAHGFAFLDPTSRVITYSANASPAQNDSFTYTISDGHGGTATASVIIRTNPTGHYTGQVVSDDGASNAAGSLVVSVNSDRSLSGRLQMDGRTYAFTGRANDANEFAAVFATAASPNSLGIQLTLVPNGAAWSVNADVQKNGVPFVAACTKGAN